MRKTGRCVVVHEAATFLGMGAELAAQIQQECFYSLEAPVLRVGGYNVPYRPRAGSRKNSRPISTGSSTPSTRVLAH